MLVTIEELGVALNQTVEVIIEYDYDPPEPMVRYYDNGDGYPGCPEQLDINSCYVLKYNNINRTDKPDWFEILDEIIYKYVIDHEEYYYELICDFESVEQEDDYNEEYDDEYFEIDNYDKEFPYEF